MSLVGPRPERPYFVARHKALQGVRLSVKPGLTGLAQVRSVYDLKPDPQSQIRLPLHPEKIAASELYILCSPSPCSSPERAGRSRSRLRIDPRLAVLAGAVVGLRVVDACLAVAVPFDASAELHRQHSQQAHDRRVVDFLDVADRAFAGLDGVEEVGPEFLDVLVVRLVELGLLVNLLLAPPDRIKRPSPLPAQVERPLRAVEEAADAFGSSPRGCRRTGDAPTSLSGRRIHRSRPDGRAHRSSGAPA